MNTGKKRSRCPVSCTLDIVGDKWSLLVVRDLMRGKRRYAEMLGSSEGIPTNILADRLRRLKAAGIIQSARYNVPSPAPGVRAHRQRRGAAAGAAGDGGLGRGARRRKNAAAAGLKRKAKGKRQNRQTATGRRQR